MAEHPLDRPVWHALAGDHAAIALGGSEARRYPAEVGPLAASRDGSPAALRALGELAQRTGPLWTLQVAVEPAPPGTIVTRRAEGVQLVLDRPVSAAQDSSLVPLGPEHRPAMLALATLTEPGPFGPRTAELGAFWGIFTGTQLVAMAGQRTRFADYVEVSAVCTHPDHRGHGHAARLIMRVAAAIAAEGRTAFLQSYADNALALALYRRLGFSERARVWLTQLTPS